MADRIDDTIAVLRELPGYGECAMLDEGSLLVYWAGEHPTEFDTLVADTGRGFDLRVEPCPWSEAELRNAMRRLCDALDRDGRLLGDRQVPVVGHESDATGLFAEVIDPMPGAAERAAILTGVPVRIVTVAHGPLAR